MTVLLQREEISLLVRVCSALFGLCRGKTEDFRQIGALVSAPGVVARLVDLIHSDSVELRGAALKLISLIFNGTSEHAQRLIDVGVLPSLQRLLSSPIASHRQDASFSFVNVMTKSHEQTMAAYHAGVLEPLCHLLQSDSWRGHCAFCLYSAAVEPLIAPRLAENPVRCLPCALLCCELTTTRKRWPCWPSRRYSSKASGMPAPNESRAHSSARPKRIH